ncbi:MAG: recombinase RecT, partial [Thermoplasmata archaeon]
MPRHAATNLAEMGEGELESRYGVTRAEIETIKKAIAPSGTTDHELLLYVGLCTRLGLNPLVPGLIHFVRFGKEGGGQRTGIVVGVYGWVALARQRGDFDGFSVTCFPEDPMKPPTHATCRIWIKGLSHPVEITRTFTEARRYSSPEWNA